MKSAFLASQAARVPVLMVGAALLLGACGSNGNDSNDGAAGRASAGGTTAGSSGRASLAGGGSASQGGGGGSSSEGFACSAVADPGEMVAVEAGDFPMGCEGSSCDEDEQPLHVVTLSAFEIDRTEVTQAEYTACIVDGTCEVPSCEWRCDEPELPAGCVTWSQAKAFCDWAGKRLPTEAEWEKAARGDEGNLYPWGDDEPDCTLANMGGCAGELRPVGSTPAGASPYGALDMAGNVVELVADWYDAGYYTSSPAADPPGPKTGTRYSGRGGGFKSDSNYLRTAKRDWYDPTDTAVSLGFRCAR